MTDKLLSKSRSGTLSRSNRKSSMQSSPLTTLIFLSPCSGKVVWVVGGLFVGAQDQNLSMWATEELKALSMRAHNKVAAWVLATPFNVVDHLQSIAKAVDNGHGHSCEYSSRAEWGLSCFSRLSIVLQFTGEHGVLVVFSVCAQRENERKWV